MQQTQDTLHQVFYCYLHIKSETSVWVMDEDNLPSRTKHALAHFNSTPEAQVTFRIVQPLLW